MTKKNEKSLPNKKYKSKNKKTEKIFKKPFTFLYFCPYTIRKGNTDNVLQKLFSKEKKI